MHCGKVTWEPPRVEETDWQTNMSENITFQHTTYVGGKNDDRSMIQGGMSVGFSNRCCTAIVMESMIELMNEWSKGGHLWDLATDPTQQ